MKLNTIYGKKTVISFEIFQPKHGAALQNIDETLEILCSLKPAFISVTFGAGGSTVNSKTVEIAKKIKEVYRVEPVVHLSCQNYTRSEILAMLNELREAGIENILALRGDEQKTRFSIETEELIVLQISFSLVFKIFFGYDSGHYALIGILLVVFRVIIAPRAFQLGCGGIDIELGLILADDDAAAVIARF